MGEKGGWRKRMEGECGKNGEGNMKKGWKKKEKIINGRWEDDRQGR